MPTSSWGRWLAYACLRKTTKPITRGGWLLFSSMGCATATIHPDMSDTAAGRRYFVAARRVGVGGSDVDVVLIDGNLVQSRRNCLHIAR